MDGVCENSVDAVSDRDFAADFLYACAVTMMHLSRLAEEMVYWSSSEFRFLSLPDALCTGSSIMPQKKNPDVAELIRGKTGRAYGNLTNLLTLMKGLPLAYNRDMQEDKEPVFDSARTVKDCLTGAILLLRGMAVNEERMRAACDDGFLICHRPRGLPREEGSAVPQGPRDHREDRAALRGARRAAEGSQPQGAPGVFEGDRRGRPQRHLPHQLRAPAEDARRDGRRCGPGPPVVAPQEVMPLARAAIALVVLLAVLMSAGCGRKAIPEPRRGEASSTATPIRAR
jgi:hypothetical protein